MGSINGLVSPPGKRPLFSFGVISDVQYADIPDGHSFLGVPRYYRHSIHVLQRAVQKWNNHQNLNFVINFGDIVDGKCPPGQSLDAVKKVNNEFQKINGPVYHLIGNHCLYNLPRDKLLPLLKIQGLNGLAYYDFSPSPEYRIVVLDGYDISAIGWPQGHSKTLQALEFLEKKNPNSDKNSPSGLLGLDRRFVMFNGAVGREQLEWLDGTLQDATKLKQKVIVCCHLPLDVVASSQEALLWNYDEVMNVIHQYNCAQTSSTSHFTMPLSNPLLLFFLLLLLTTLTTSQLEQTTYLPPLDAVSILSFKSKADLDNKLFYTLNERYDYCQWQGIKCAQGRVVRVVLQGFGLRGTFPPFTLSRLDQLRVLSLQNNSLCGPIPDLSPLFNLKSLFLNHNSFSASFPPSILLLHRLTILDLSYNNLAGQLPVNLSSLDRLNSLQLEFNQFNGTLPSLDLRLLVFFNVSGNNLTGPIPLTPTLSRFDTSSFSLNPFLCGEIINKACKPRSPFFDSSASPTASSPAGVPFGQSAQAGGGVVVSITPPSKQKPSRSGVVLGFTVGVSVLVLSLLCFVLVLVKKQKQERHAEEEKEQVVTGTTSPVRTPSNNPAMQSQVGEKGHEIINTKAKEGLVQQVRKAEKSGSLVFCGGKTQVYTLEQLMRASAELLGRGTIGTTYKAVLDNQLIVTVKRLDASKTAITSSDVFERHMDVVGALRHPNLVPIAAYFQAKGERLVIFDYQPNGSLFNLIHGSRSTRAKPLHWTSCLKIAEDVAQGLAYIHQTSNLVHGNLKSANVLLGADFEACITDYCLAMLADTSSSENPDSAACKAPETRKASRRATSKSDVYAFGVLLLELLTGKHPSQHPYLVPADMLDWVRTVRDDGSGDDNQLGMLTEVASVCSLTSPEQRPAMWQVLKMIQEIKDNVMVEDNAADGYS